VPSLAWLGVAIVAGAGAYLVGWPAWQGYRQRETRDENAERYLAWRGRADRTPRTTTREGMTGEERRRVYAGAALAVIAVIGLLAFFATS
jgi:hypothetical protein